MEGFVSSTEDFEPLEYEWSGCFLGFVCVYVSVFVVVSMGSMGEPDRKRRHFSSPSPTPAAVTPKKLPFLPISEDKKVPGFFFNPLFVIFQYLNLEF